MLWSILICAVPERYHSVHGLLHGLLEIQAVARRPDVELLYLLDNKRRSVGAKRNALLNMAHGEYISFVDDDDEVATDYVQKILGAIVKGRRADPIVDVICFPQRATLRPQGVVHECTYSLKYWRDREPEKRRVLAPSGEPSKLLWTGPPAHTMVWRRGLIEGTDPAVIKPLRTGTALLPCLRFPEKNFGEDVDWVDAVCDQAKTEVQIEGEPLYFYYFDENRTATR